MIAQNFKSKNRISTTDFEKLIKHLDNFNGTIDPNLTRNIYRGIMSASNENLWNQYVAMLDNFSNQATTLSLTSKRPLFLPVPPKAESTGLRVGRYIQGDRMFSDAYVSLSSSIHTNISGKTNSGKTNLIMGFCLELDRYNDGKAPEERVCRIIVDKKSDYKYLPDQIVLDIKKVPYNILDPPPGVDFVTWLLLVSQSMMNIWQTYAKARNIFEDKAVELWKNSDCKKIPKITEIRDSMVNEYKNFKITGRREEGLEVVFDRLNHMILDFKESSSFRKTFPLHFFVQNGIPLTIHAQLSPDNYAVLCSNILLRLYKHAEVHNIRGNIGIGGGGVVFIMDESGDTFDRAKSYGELRHNNGIDFLTAAATWIRDFRVLLVTSAQQPLVEEIHNSAELLIVGKVSSWDHARYMANCLGKPELAEMITNLDQGTFIMKYDNHVSLIHADKFDLERFSDEVIEEHMKPVMKFIYDCCREEEEEKEEKVPKLNLTDDARRLLFHVWAFPGKKLSERYEPLGLEGERQRSVVNELKNSGYAEEVKLPVDRKSSHYLVLTKKATDWLKHSAGKNCDHLVHIGGQGPVHSMWQQLLLTRLKDFHKMNVWHDRYVPDEKGKLVDVYAESEDKKVGFEIAVHRDIDSFRVNQALSAVDEYIILADTVEVEKFVHMQLSGLDSAKIKYFSLKQYVSNLKSANIGLYYNNNQNQHNNPNTSQNSQNGLETTKKHPSDQTSSVSEDKGSEE